MCFPIEFSPEKVCSAVFTASTLDQPKKTLGKKYFRIIFKATIRNFCSEKINVHKKRTKQLMIACFAV